MVSKLKNMLPFGSGPSSAQRGMFSLCFLDFRAVKRKGNLMLPGAKDYS